MSIARQIVDDENYFLDLTSSYQPVIAVTAVVLICLNVQMAFFFAVGISYTGKKFMLFSFSSF
jgi:hypothetical protein